MTNTPKKITDPTEAALSAIQDALSIRDGAPQPEPASPSPPAATVQSEEPAPEPPWRAIRASAPGDGNGFDLETGVAQEQGALRPPGSEERESISEVLRTLQHRPART